VANDGILEFMRGLECEGRGGACPALDRWQGGQGEASLAPTTKKPAQSAAADCATLPEMLTLNPQQAAVLEKLVEKGFQMVSFALYANCVGVKRGNCAALLAPQDGAGLRLFGEVCYLVDGQLSVRVVRGGQELYVWKKKELTVTAERAAEVAAFRRELLALLS
jgi:hypothetical protein